jgi:hypothetical protein
VSDRTVGVTSTLNAEVSDRRSQVELQVQIRNLMTIKQISRNHSRMEDNRGTKPYRSPCSETPPCAWETPPVPEGPPKRDPPESMRMPETQTKIWELHGRNFLAERIVGVGMALDPHRKGTTSHIPAARTHS